MLAPNNQPAPRGLTAQLYTSSGSLHIKSEGMCNEYGYEKRGGMEGNGQPAYILLGRWYMREGGSDSPQNAPSWGISCPLESTRIWSNVRTSGESPPCTHSVVPSIIYEGGGILMMGYGGRQMSPTAARLRKSNTLQHAFHTVALPYFCWHSSVQLDLRRWNGEDGGCDTHHRIRRLV